MAPRRNFLARAFGAAALLLVVAGATAGPAASEDKMQRMITITASGSVPAKPDIARIQSGVVTEAKTAKDALSSNNAAMQKLIDALKQAGVAAADLQTSSINVSPRYAQNKDGRAPQIDGYSVHNDLSVIVRDIEKLGDILDKLVTLGANQVGGLSFDIAKPGKLRDEARKAAIAEAHRQASLYAEAAGVTLGEVLTISEGAASAPAPIVMRGRAALASSVPIEQGSQLVEVEVTVAWALK